MYHRGCTLAKQVGGFSRKFATAAALSFVHSDLAYRALLRNLRLLKGLRGDVNEFNVAVVGTEANALAKQFVDTEPAIKLEILGESADTG